MRVGVLALQGAFAEHERVLRHLSVDTIEVRLPHHLEGLDGLIIPGGESTTIGQVAQRWGLLEPIRAFAQSGRPVWGTCAGMILMAREVVDGVPGQILLRLMHIVVHRNALGRQVDSFEADLDVPALGEPPFHAVFIRAPIVERVGQEVEVLAQLEDGMVVAARQGNLLVTAFHPELTEDTRLHTFFLNMGRAQQKE
jgi:5'-phosphate synthase pdxT subunit